MSRTATVLLLVLAATGCVFGLEVGLSISRSPIVTTLRDDEGIGPITTYLVPTGAQVDVQLPLKNAMEVGLQAVYAGGLLDDVTHYSTYKKIVRGFQVQGCFAGAVPVMDGRLTFRGGLAVGYCGYSTRAWVPYSNDTEEASTTGFFQTFLVGMKLRMTSKLSFGVQSELAGLALLHDWFKYAGSWEERYYRTFQGGFYPGVSAGLRLTL